MSSAALSRLFGRGEKPKEKPAPGAITPREGPADAAEQPQEKPCPCMCGCGADVGPNNEKLEDVHPKAIAALRDMMLNDAVEGIVSRRWEARKDRDAHLAWMGVQNGYYSPYDFAWHLPFGTSVGLGLGIDDPDEDYESPTYDYVTNYYQAYGLAFQVLMTAKLPTPKFRPGSAQNEADITTAKAADDVRKLNERNNPPQKLLRRYSWLGWCEGKIGGFVRWVTDGQRFGFDTVVDVDTDLAKISDDAYVCSNCGAENPPQVGSPGETGFCRECGAEIGPEDFRRGDYVPVPKETGSREVPKGQVCLTLVPGLEFHTPPWATEQYEFPYVRWNKEVEKAKLKAAYPHAADKITSGGPMPADEVQLRVWRLQVQQGFPVTMPGGALANLVTFSREWMRPWKFWEQDDKDTRKLLMKLFPHGAYVAFAGEAYCESRDENLDEHWRVSHMLEGDGQNRPGVGDSSLQVNKQINDLSNIEQEAYDYGLPITFGDAETLNTDAINNSTAKPGDIIPVKTRANEPGGLAAKFFQTEPAEVSPAAVARRQELSGPVLQFLTGIQPAAIGSPDEENQTAEGRSVAREQAMGRIGLFYREMSRFYGECHLLAVRCHAKNATADAELVDEQEDGGFESKYIRQAELQGNIELWEEPDTGFPALPSEVRASIEGMLNHPVLGPMLLQNPANIGRAKDIMGLDDFVAPSEDMETKTRRMIKQLLQSGPIQPPPQMAAGAQGPIAMPTPAQPTVQLDPQLDDPTVAVAELRRWYQSDAGQAAGIENPAGVENVRAFFAHCQQIARQQAQTAAQQKPPSESISYKDMTPTGKVQMAAQAGITEDPAEIQQADQQDQIAKAQQNAAKIAAIHAKGAQSATPPGQ